MSRPMKTLTLPIDTGEEITPVEYTFVEVESTFTTPGKAADSKATGDRLDAVEADVTEIEQASYAAFVVDTASGAIATFPDGADSVPVKSLTVDIEPVQSGSGDPSPSNVRPITGHTQAVVTRTGVNVWGEEWESGGINDSTGEKVSVDTQLRSKNFINCMPNTQYYCDFENVGTGGLYLYGYDADGNFIARIQKQGGVNNVANAVVSTPANCYKLMLKVQYSISSPTHNHDISINYPSTDHDYHSGADNESYTIDLNGTVYGGSLDVSSGVLTVDRGFYTLTGSESWSAWDTHAYYSACLPSDAVNTNNTVNCISSMLEGETTDAIYLGASGVGARTSRLYISATEYASIGTFTGMQVCYKLATPLTVQLTAEEVMTLLGQNNIFCDTGNVAVEYRADTKKYIEKILNA